MKSPFRSSERTAGACAICKVMTETRRPATTACKRCNRPLCEQHEHGASYRCMACEAGYEPPDELPDPSMSAGFWLGLTGAFTAAAFSMVAMGMDILLLAAASVGIGTLGFSARALNRRRLAKHRQRFLLAEAGRQERLKRLGDGGSAAGRS